MLLTSVKLRYEQDVVLARQRARQISELLGFDVQDQVRIATAVSEIARDGLRHGEGPAIEFRLELPANRFLIRLHCESLRHAHDEPQNALKSTDGIVAARRIMGHADVERRGAEVFWTFGKPLPLRTCEMEPALVRKLSESVGRAEPRDLYQEFQAQNQELLDALTQVRQHQTELAKVNLELEETNRGVVALYAELEEKAESLRRAGEQKTRFYSSISHEFRTPVTSILSLSQILLDRLDGDLTTEQERQIQLIRKCGHDLLEWVNDLLDFARADLGRMKLRVEDFTLEGVLSGLRGVMRPLATGDVALIIDDPPPDVPPLHTDQQKLTQILRNLVSNALKFTERGEVRVSAGLAPDRDSVCFVVKDTGIGIAPEHHARIFEEFVQVDSGVPQRIKGTGLGLPLSRRLAALLGGTIQVSSALGRGSQFTLEIARCMDAEASLAPAEGQSTAAVPLRAIAAGDRPRALLIDDDPASRYLLAQVLAQLAVEVTEADSGRQGLGIAGSTRPQVIFLDLMMPDMSGFEVLDELRRSSATRDIPIVVHSALELNDQQRRALQEAGCRWLPKPAQDVGLAIDALQQTLQDVGVRAQHP